MELLNKERERIAMTRFYKIILMSTVVSSLSFEAIAQEEDNPLSLSVGVAIERDSNLTVDAIDESSNAGDTAMVFDTTIGYDFVDDDKIGFSAGYDFYKSSYKELDQFNMAIHGFNIDGRYTIDRADLGMTYLFNTIKLGGESFLDMHTIKPSVGYLLPSNNVYLIGGIDYQKQVFKKPELTGRDATRYTGNVKSIFLLGEGRTVTGGYNWTDHNTQDPGYSYTGHTLSASLKLPFDLIDREAVLRTGFKHQSKSYAMESSSYNGGEERSDKRSTVTFALEVPIVKGFIGTGGIEYINSNSNYAPVDFKETIATFGVSWKF